MRPSRRGSVICPPEAVEIKTIKRVSNWSPKAGGRDGHRKGKKWKVDGCTGAQEPPSPPDQLRLGLRRCI